MQVHQKLSIIFLMGTIIHRVSQTLKYHEEKVFGALQFGPTWCREIFSSQSKYSELNLLTGTNTHNKNEWNENGTIFVKRQRYNITSGTRPAYSQSIVAIFLDIGTSTLGISLKFDCVWIQQT